MLDDPLIGLQYWNNGLGIEVRERNPRHPTSGTCEPPDGIEIIQRLACRVVGLQENPGLNCTDAHTPQEDIVDDKCTRHTNRVDRLYSRETDDESSSVGLIQLLSRLWPNLFERVKAPANLCLSINGGHAISINVQGLYFSEHISTSKGPVVACLGLDQIPHRIGATGVLLAMVSEHFPKLALSTSTHRRCHSPSTACHVLSIIVPDPQNGCLKFYRGEVHVLIPEQRLDQRKSKLVVTGITIKHGRVSVSPVVSLSYRLSIALFPEGMSI